jgi:hypothetical protein
MKYIINFFSKRISKELPNPIGITNITFYNKKNNNKIDSPPSNKDHSEQYSKIKIDSQNKTAASNNDKNDDSNKKT